MTEGVCAMLIDTHAHYDHVAFDEDREDLLRQVRAAGVERIVCPAIGFESNQRMIEVLGDHEEVSFAVGIHPKYVVPPVPQGGREPDVPEAQASVHDLHVLYDMRATQLAKVEEELSALGELALSRPRVVAIGETGLDYSRHPQEFERCVQRAAFRAQIEIALSLDLPLVLHIRDAHREAADILHSYRTRFTGVVHCFCQGPSEAKEYLAMGLTLGIGGKVTYPQHVALHEALGSIPLNRIVLETDAPFVVPEGWPTRRNDSTAIPQIAWELARLMGVSVEEVAAVSTETARQVFFSGT